MEKESQIGFEGEVGLVVSVVGAKVSKRGCENQLNLPQSLNNYILKRL